MSPLAFAVVAKLPALLCLNPCDILPQGAVEARNANYAQIAAQLAFKRAGWVDEEASAAALKQVGSSKRLGGGAAPEAADGSEAEDLAEEEEGQVRFSTSNQAGMTWEARELWSGSVDSVL